MFFLLCCQCLFFFSFELLLLHPVFMMSTLSHGRGFHGPITDRGLGAEAQPGKGVFEGSGQRFLPVAVGLQFRSGVAQERRRSEERRVGREGRSWWRRGQSLRKAKRR